MTEFVFHNSLQLNHFLKAQESQLPFSHKRVDSITCTHDQNIINFLLTEREGRTGEYWPKVMAKTTEGQYSPVRLELAQLVSSLLYAKIWFYQRS